MISILADIGNKAYALPMVQAYPTDVNLQQLLAWDPVNQALVYAPYTGNVSGDFGVTRDLAVGRDLSVVDSANIAGDLTVVGNVAIPNVSGSVAIAAGLSVGTTISAVGNITSAAIVQGLTVKAVSGGNNAELKSSQLEIQALKVIGARITGWEDPTGTATRTTFATGAVTLPQLAERVMALILDLKTHGMIAT